MATLQFPIIFCSTVPGCGMIDIPLPFGLPTQHLANPTCVSPAESLKQLLDLLKPLMPYLQLITCAMDLIDILIGIPKAMGPPPDPGKIVSLVQKVNDFLTNCLPLIISYTPPGAIVPLVCMIKGVCQYLAAILTEIKLILNVTFGVAIEALTLSKTNDPLLQQMGICLAGQNQTLSNDLLNKFNSLLSIFTLLNFILQNLPEVPQLLQQAGITLPIGPQAPQAGNFVDTSAFDEIIQVLNFVVAALSPICH